MKKTLLSLGLIANLGINQMLLAQYNATTLRDPITGQQPCGFTAPSDESIEWLNKAVEQLTLEKIAGKQMATRTIPVIIPVVHAGEAIGVFPNLSTTQLVSQIKVVIDDYAGKGYNINLTPSVWASLVTDVGVTFCLATKDPNGNVLTEPGIHRVKYSSLSGVNDPKSGTAGSNNNTFINYIDTKLKPATIWDVTKYLNIWVTDKPSDGTGLGVAMAPAGTSLPGGNDFTTGNSSTDGLWCWAKCFGTTGTLASGYDKGRVSSHEIGHYLGLQHTWGKSSCVSDYCNDTPICSGPTFNCPSYPNSGTACSGSGAVMTMNIMDYTNDGCKYLFTKDQATRIQAAMTQSPNRKLLGTHNLCDITNTVSENNFLGSNVIISPNPTSGIFTITFNTSDPINVNASIYNAVGKLVFSQELKSMSATEQKNDFDLSGFAPGIYYFHLKSVQGNYIKKIIILGE